MNSMLIELARDQRKNTTHKARKTIYLVIQFLQKNTDIGREEVIQTLEGWGRAVSKAKETAFPVINTLKRVISMVKRSKFGKMDDQTVQESNEVVQTTIGEDHAIDEITSVQTLMSQLVTLNEEFTQISGLVSEFILPHLENQEVILTFGTSETLYKCFEAALESKKQLKILVVNTESQKASMTQKEGEIPLDPLQKLRDLGIEAYEVSQSSIFAIMPKVTMVLVSCFAVMQDGGILSRCGIFGLGMMAKEFSIPFLVVSSQYKLTPKFCFNQMTYNEFQNPNQIFPAHKLLDSDSLDILVPAFDFVPPEYITLHITETGEFTNFYIYRLFNEIYTKEEINANY